jgi:hypothetical protein
MEEARNFEGGRGGAGGGRFARATRRKEKRRPKIEKDGRAVVVSVAVLCGCVGKMGSGKTKRWGYRRSMAGGDREAHQQRTTTTLHKPRFMPFHGPTYNLQVALFARASALGSSICPPKSTRSAAVIIHLLH